jgi:drug/metabolite transporter (DMT)-like permease
MPSSSTRSRQIGLLFVLITAIGWGLNWPVMKLVLRDWPPLFARGVAGSFAAAGLALAAIASRQSLAVPARTLVPLCAAAALNVFAWMGFSTMAMVWLSVSEGALLVYTMPIWAMLLAWPIRGARPSLRGIAALVLGISGLAVLFGGPHVLLGSDRWPGAVLALAAAILFALGTVTLRSPLPLPPLSLTAWQVGLACVPLISLGLLFEEPRFEALTPTGLGAMSYMTVVPMGVCYLSWFAALRRLPPTTASMATLLTPVIGVVGAAFALGEPLGLEQVLALGLTLSGVAIALRRE